MGHLFRIPDKNSGTSSTIEDWHASPLTPYDSGYVDTIQDITTTQKEITSIPSPFARIELVKEAFGKIINNSLASMGIEEIKSALHGATIYHKMVSDTLDIGQIFFSYPTMKDNFEIIVWDRDQCINDLTSSSNTSHNIVGRTLDMFFQQDSMGNDPYNFGKMQRMYILRYIGPGHRQMHIVGATSPATLFFSTANDESAISKFICFGEDYAFDSEYASLDQRDPEFIKYLFTLRYSDPNFGTHYPEVAGYMDAVYSVLDDELKKELNDIQNKINNNQPNQKSYIDSEYSKLQFEDPQNNTYTVDINGRSFHVKDVTISGHSDFEIKSKKYKGEQAPLVLPVTRGNLYESLEYFGSKFGRNIQVPYFDPAPEKDRRLPGINHQYPYLTISDFLDDKIIQLPSEINEEYFFSGNFNSNTGLNEGFLLPILPKYFDYFGVEDLMGMAPSGKKTVEIKKVASGVEVFLRIPIQKNQEVEYKRLYTLDVKAEKSNNIGAIVLSPKHFELGIFPPVKFDNIEDAIYRISLICKYGLNKESTCKFHNERQGFYDCNYVVRNVDEEDDLRSKIFLIENNDFDCLYLSILSDHQLKENRGSGLIVPKLKKKNGVTRFKFAIDLGTSNTHIEFKSGENELPKPFTQEKIKPQIALLCKPNDVIKDVLNQEFIPDNIGPNGVCQFPIRTVLGTEKNNSGINENGVAKYVAFGNASPAFMYNATKGGKYNEYVTNLKWSNIDDQNEERIRSYIESLFLLIRTKVLQEGGSLHQTQIKWFYPISMSNNKKAMFERVWIEAYQKYFNINGEPTAITESIAPYSFFQQTRSDVTDIVTIDIGGETTDIVVADSSDVKLISSMRFAADAIFGNSLVRIQNGPLNGIIRQFKDVFLNRLSHHSVLKEMLIEQTENNFGNSSEVASFLFSLVDHPTIRKSGNQNLVDFNEILMKDNSQKIVFYIFYTAIIYHLANMMKAKGLSRPSNIAFSGNGSKVVSVLSPSPKILEEITSRIFELIYDEDYKKIQVILNSRNPKEATCKGGLMLNQEFGNLNDKKVVLFGSSPSSLVTTQKYENVPHFYNDIVEEVRSFMDFITLTLPKKISLNNDFGIDPNFTKLAVESFNKDLKVYIEKGVGLKLDSREVNKDDIVEETLFFYPIIGVMNDLSDQICKLEMTKNHN